MNHKRLLQCLQKSVMFNHSRTKKEMYLNDYNLEFRRDLDCALRLKINKITSGTLIITTRKVGN